MLEIELLSLEVHIILLKTQKIGSFAMWGGVFSSMDCLMIYYRQKDDPWNAVASGFITGGVLAIRSKI